MERTKIIHQCIFTIFISLLLASVSHAGKSSKHNSLNGLRIDLRHIDSHGNFTKQELLQRMTRRSHQRMRRLVKRSNNPNSHNSHNSREHGFNFHRGSSAETDVHVGSGEYVMDISVGTPSITFPAIIDTGSDLIWTQCEPCERCFKQPTKIFNPSNSSTFKKLPCTAKLCKQLPVRNCSNSICQYQYVYGDMSFTSGNLSSETFTLGSKRAKKIAFGCGDFNSDGFSESSGLVGLGRNKLSLISQLKLKEFSYCFASLDEKKQSPMFFGPISHANDSVGKTTPLLKVPKNYFYYLSLLGITVGTIKLDIPSSTFAVQKNGTGGMIIDSGTSITYLQQPGYSALKKAFAEQFKLPVVDGSDVGFDLCFKLPTELDPNFVVPGLIFHFEGADLNLPKSNYLIQDLDTGKICLTIMGSPGMSIFGSMQQENFKIIYNVKKNKLTFIPTQCDKL